MCWEPDPQQRSSVLVVSTFTWFSKQNYRLERGRLDWHAVEGKGFDGTVDNHFLILLLLSTVLMFKIK